MFCFSTGNQTVNFLPAKQLNIPKVIVATTEKEKGENLKKVFKSHKISSKFFSIGNFSDINELKKEFLKETKDERNDKLIFITCFLTQFFSYLSLHSYPQQVGQTK